MQLLFLCVCALVGKSHVSVLLLLLAPGSSFLAPC